MNKVIEFDTKIKEVRQNDCPILVTSFITSSNKLG